MSVHTGGWARRTLEDIGNAIRTARARRSPSGAPAQAVAPLSPLLVMYPEATRLAFVYPIISHCDHMSGPRFISDASSTPALFKMSTDAVLPGKRSLDTKG